MSPDVERQQGLDAKAKRRERDRVELYKRIRQLRRKEPMLTNAAIASRLGCSTGLVSRVLANPLM